MLDRDKLQQALRDVEDQTSLYELSKILKVSTEEILTLINDEITPEYTEIFKKNAFKLPLWSMEKTQEFFQNPIVDTGFLVQHKIKEIYEVMKSKLDAFGHQAFYNSWILNRGY